MNRELAEHVSLIAAPIYAAMLARAEPREVIGDREWQDTAMSIAIKLAHKLWIATLDTE
jgi:hypothetical protein